MICINSVSVYPQAISLKVGTWSYAAYAEVCPLDADCKEVQWHSDNPSVASVNASSGYICANGVGTAHVYATATDGSGCSDYLTVTVSNMVPVTSVTLNRSSLSLEEGHSASLSTTICPDNATNKNVNWTSSDNCVATVCNGIVTAVSKGSARITATAVDGSGKSAYCLVSVTGDVLVTSIEITPCNTTLQVGYSIYPSITVCPSDATEKSVTWSSANSNIAFVNPNSGLVYAKAVGTTTIYATACDGSGVCGCCTVRVVPVYVQDIIVCPEALDLNVGDSSCLEATVYPVNATDPNISWTTGDCNIADVDDNGCVTAKSVGTTYICANATDGSGVHGCCEVTCYTSGTDSIGVFRSLSTLSATPADAETGAPVMLGVQFTEPQNGNYRIRFISQIKTIHYQGVGFEIHSKFGDDAPVANIVCSKVAYTSLLADGETVYPDNGFDYFVLGIMENIPENTIASFKIVPFAITLEREFLYGNTSLFSCKDAQPINSDDFETPEHLNALDQICVNTGNGSNLNIRALPSKNGNVLGQFANGRKLALILESPRNEKWYAVYGRTVDGTYKLGWCSGEYLGNYVEYGTLVDVNTLNVRSGAGTNYTSLGAISKGDTVEILEKNCATASGYTWHKILYNGSEGYVVAGNNTPNFTFETKWVALAGESDSYENVDVSALTPIASNEYLTQRQMENNAMIIYDYLLKQGWTKNAICGAIANMQAESTINPGLWEKGNTTNPGYGLVQWTPATKWTDYADIHGYNYSDLNRQLEYLSYSMQPGRGEWLVGGVTPTYQLYADEYISSTRSAYDLSIVFLLCYERPLDQSDSVKSYRGSLANSWLSFFNSLGW